MFFENFIDVYYSHLNYVARERLDPLLFGLLRMFGFEHSQVGYVGLELTVLFAGCWVLLWMLNARPRSCFLGALAGLLACVLCVGVDPFFLKFHWFPLLTASFTSLCIRVRAWALVGSFVSIAGWCLSAGSLGVFGALTAAGAASVFATHIAGSDDERQRFAGSVLAVLGTAAIVLSFLLLPEYPMPEYPSGARLAPISPLLFQSKPLLGPSLEPNPMLFSAFELELVSSIGRLLAVVCCVICSLVFLRTPKESVLSGVIVLLIVFFMVSVECIISDSYHFFTPVRSISRIVPGFALSQFPSLLAPFGVILAFSLIVPSIGIIRAGILNLLLALCLVFSVLPPWVDHFAVKSGGRSGSHRESIEKSPSRYLVSVRGEWTTVSGVGAAREFSALKRLEMGKDFSWKVDASVNPEHAFLAIDGDAHSRWSTSRPQKPGDSFSVSFAESVNLIRVVLSVRNCPTDFPRGLSVEISLDGEDYREIFHETDWLGPTKWTPKGYPYFGPQHQVVLDFPKEETLRYLRFTQLGQSPHYDWSIGEIKLYSTRP